MMSHSGARAPLIRECSSLTGLKWSSLEIRRAKVRLAQCEPAESASAVLLEGLSKTAHPAPDPGAFAPGPLSLATTKGYRKFSKLSPGYLGL
jgi:hypothetical protein